MTTSQKKGKDEAKCKGLLITLTYKSFLINIAIMLDALTEIALLSTLIKIRDTSYAVSQID